jgi:hypothetical protein
MQALNHVVFGSLIAVITPEPALALPLSFGSHFVLDAIPHYGSDPQAPRGSRAYNLRILVDAVLSTLVILLFLSLNPPRRGLLLACVFFAILPDLIWPVALFIKHRGPLWAFFKFHKTIQRESRKGIILELIWFLVSTLVVVLIITN